MKDQFVLTSNNGVASMILNDELNDSVYKFSSQMNTFDFQQYIDQFIFVLNLIANNKYANVLEVNPSIVQTKPFTNGLMIREDSIISRVVAIRSSGSIILNLSKDQFDTAVGDKSFYIQFVNIKIRSI
jgi:ethanolamine utilization protein EutA (predicted chaperonin)